MTWIRAACRELFGLVVDDVGFAGVVLGWIALVWIVSSYAFAKSEWLSMLLFAGLGAILVHSVTKRSKQTNRT